MTLRVKKELIAGLTTFSTMAYVMVVNPLILGEAGIDFSSAMIATILSSFLATFIMGAFANYPFALAPGIAMSAYFTYSVVRGHNLSWQTGLGIVFVTGLILLLLWVFKLRQKIIHAIPHGLKIAATAGVGLFLVAVAFKQTKILAPESLLVILGIIVIVVLMIRKVPGAILIGILLNWALGLALGLVSWKGIVSLPQFSTQAFMAMDLQGATHPQFWILVFSFVFISLFDTAGSLMGLAHHGHFLDKRGHLPRLQKALLADGLGTTLGGCLGTSPSTIYVESASGIAAGGRTGLTAITVSLLMLASLFFEPLASSIPVFAVTPVLIIVGILMLRAAAELAWKDASEWIPGLAVVIGIPLTFSIATGIGLGMLLYPICKLIAGKARDVHPITWVLAALFVLYFVFKGFS